MDLRITFIVCFYAVMKNIYKWEHTGAILAGGKSSRMGSLKEGIKLLDKRPMIEHVIEPLKEVCKKVVIVGKCEGYVPSEDIEIIPDNIAGRGPLSGIEALLDSGIDNEYLVVSCDQPLVTSDLLVLLTREKTMLPRFFLTPEEFNPFPGVYPESWKNKIKDAIENENLSLCKLIDNSKISCVMLTKKELTGQLKSINTQKDLEKINKEAQLLA